MKRQGTHLEFQLVEQDRTLPVVYGGTEAPPDTFKDNAQALAEGRFGRDGVFHATNIQAKCASKYAPKPGAQPGAAQGPQSTAQNGAGRAWASRRLQASLTDTHTMAGTSEPHSSPVIILENLVKFFGRFAAAARHLRQLLGGTAVRRCRRQRRRQEHAAARGRGLMEPSQGSFSIWARKTFAT